MLERCHGRRVPRPSGLADIPGAESRHQWIHSRIAAVAAETVGLDLAVDG